MPVILDVTRPLLALVWVFVRLSLEAPDPAGHFVSLDGDGLLYSDEILESNVAAGVLEDDITAFTLALSHVVKVFSKVQGLERIRG